MQKRQNPLLVFLIFSLFSIFLLGLSKAGLLSGVQSVLERIISFPKESSRNLVNGIFFLSADSHIKELQEENKKLLKELIDNKVLEKENSALRDQFKTSYPKSSNLLPAKIIGAPGFIPGVSEPENLIINKGTKDNVKAGEAIVFKDHLVGKVSITSSFVSQVTLLTSSKISFTGKTLKTGAFGVIRGGGSGQMTFENVLLSENLNTSDLVLTTGDQNINEVGLPPDLIVGKITSIEKKSSALFQTASIKSDLDFSKLSTVFIVLTSEK